MNRTMPAKLPDSQRALADYLDDMLHQATSSAPARPVIDKEQPSLSVELMLQSATRAAAPDARPMADKPGPVVEENNAPVERTAAAEFDYPMQCLMFQVAGHLLGYRLVDAPPPRHG